MLGILFAVIVYRLSIATALFALDNRTAKERARFITSLTASIINLIACKVFSTVGLVVPTPRGYQPRAGLKIWWALRSPQRRGPTVTGGAKGVEMRRDRDTEFVEGREGVTPSPADQGSGERHTLPQWGPWEALAENGFWRNLSLKMRMTIRISGIRCS